MQKEEASNFMKKLLALVFPIAFQQFMLALVNASDALMLGFLSQDALSAVSLAGQVSFVENLFLAAMTIGLSVFAAQYWGKGDKESVERVFAHVLKITVFVSFGFFLAGMCIPQALMRIFAKEQPLVAGGAVYLRAVSVSFLLTGISQVFLCVFKNSGKALKASIISSAGVLINIALNAVLIFGFLGFPKLGIRGAAYATVAARLIELLWCLFESAKKDSIKLRWKYFTKDAQFSQRNFWKYTAPILGNEMVWGVGFAMYSVIMGHLGTDAVAANSITSVVKNLTICFSIGLASGGGIMIGNELGAGRLETAKEYGRKLCRMSIVCGLISGLVLLAFTPLLLAVTDLSAAAGEYLKSMLAICACYMVGKSVNMTTISGIFCAGGDSRFGFVCDAVTMWCITVPLGFLAAFWLQLPVVAVYCIVNLDEMIKLPAVYKNYKKYKWVKDLTGMEETQ